MKYKRFIKEVLVLLCVILMLTIILILVIDKCNSIQKDIPIMVMSIQNRR